MPERSVTFEFARGDAIRQFRETWRGKAMRWWEYIVPTCLLVLILRFVVLPTLRTLLMPELLVLALSGLMGGAFVFAWQSSHRFWRLAAYSRHIRRSKFDAYFGRRTLILGDASLRLIYPRGEEARIPWDRVHLHSEPDRITVRVLGDQVILIPDQFTDRAMFDAFLAEMRQRVSGTSAREIADQWWTQGAATIADEATQRFRNGKTEAS